MPKSFTYVRKGGYDPQEVDDYLERLEKEIESFRQREQMISNAIMDAQLTSKKIIKKAEDEANHIQKDAILQLDSIRRKVSYIKQKIESFQISYNQFIERFTVSINHEDIDKLYYQLDELSSALQVEKSNQAPTYEPKQNAPAFSLNEQQNVNSFSSSNESFSLPEHNPNNKQSTFDFEEKDDSNSFNVNDIKANFNESKANSFNVNEIKPNVNTSAPKKSDDKEDDDSSFLGLGDFHSNLFTID